MDPKNVKTQKLMVITIIDCLIRPGAYPISGTELYPVSLLATAMTDVGGRGRVPLWTTLRRDTHIPWWVGINWNISNSAFFPPALFFVPQIHTNEIKLPHVYH